MSVPARPPSHSPPISVRSTARSVETVRSRNRIRQVLGHRSHCRRALVTVILPVIGGPRRVAHPERNEHAQDTHHQCARRSARRPASRHHGVPFDLAAPPHTAASSPHPPTEPRHSGAPCLSGPTTNVALRRRPGPTPHARLWERLHTCSRAASSRRAGGHREPRHPHACRATHACLHRSLHATGLRWPVPAGQPSCSPSPNSRSRGRSSS